MSIGAQILNPVELQRVLDSSSGVRSILERLMEQMGEYFGDVEVSPLMAGPCRLSAAEGRSLGAISDANGLHLTL